MNHAGSLAILYAFTGGADGGRPIGGLVLDSASNLYGTTSTGGNELCGQGCGTVFELNTSGVETVLYTFTGGADGGLPDAGLVLDKAGNLYGTTSLGGETGDGVVFKLDTTRKETVLHSFAGHPDGREPLAGLIFDKSASLYGTTIVGGTGKICSPGCGTVFKVDTSATESVLYSFSGGADGSGPRAPLILDTNGNLYGTTVTGGAYRHGTVFRLDASGTETVLHSFDRNRNGVEPSAGLVRDSAGNLYGTTSGGTGRGNGVVFELDKAGKEIVLHHFTGGEDGAFPYSGLARDAAGNFYGTTSQGGGNTCGEVTCGVVFKITP